MIDYIREVAEFCTIEIDEIRKGIGSKTIGYGAWLSQGCEDDSTDYYISEDDIDSYIKALEDMKIEIQRRKDLLNKEVK